MNGRLTASLRGWLYGASFMVTIFLAPPIEACVHYKEGVHKVREGNVTRYLAVARVETLAVDDAGFKLAEDEAQAIARVRLHRKLPTELRGPGPETLQGVSVIEVCREQNHVLVAIETSTASVKAARALAEATRREPASVDRPVRIYE